MLRKQRKNSHLSIILPSQRRCPCPFGASPIYPFQEHRKLRRGKRNTPRLGHWPDETPPVDPRGKQAHLLSIIPKQLDQMTTFTTEGEQRARMRALLQHLLNQHRQTIKTFMHIGHAARQPHLGRAGARQRRKWRWRRGRRRCGYGGRYHPTTDSTRARASASTPASTVSLIPDESSIPI